MTRGNAPLLAWFAAGALALAPGCDGTGDDDTTVGDDDSAASDDDTADGDDDSADVGEVCDRYNTWGWFTIETDDSDGNVRGFYYDGQNPYEMNAVVEDGPCAFYGFDHIPYCDPPCESPEVCGFDDQCRAFPSVVSAGTLTVTGTDPTLEVEPGVGTDYSTGPAMPNLYEPGAELTLSASGSEHVDPFELTVEGVVGPSDPWHITVFMIPGEDLLVEWDPVEVPSDARMQVQFTIDHHALVGGYAMCDVPDADGQVVVPGSITEALFGTGSHPENGDLYRYTRSAVETNLGCAEWISHADGFIHVDF